MKVKLSEIPEEGLTLNEHLDPAQMRLDTPELKFTAPLDLTATFQEQRETVWVQVGISGQMRQICGRCLEPYEKLYNGSFHLDYAVKGMFFLDITDDVRQEILLSYPIRFLCREDCLGLCPQCGTNLNERSCHHASA